MKSNQPSRKDLSSLCGEIHADDGIDPRKFFKKSSRKDNYRKDRQLCGQVTRALSLVLADESDDIIRNLQVLSVIPNPDSSRLLVTVAQPGEIKVAANEVLAKLQNLSAKLRYEIAAAIHRKRTPILVFCMGGEGGSL